MLNDAHQPCHAPFQPTCRGRIQQMATQQEDLRTEPSRACLRGTGSGGQSPR